MRVYYFPQNHRNAGEIFQVLHNGDMELIDAIYCDTPVRSSIEDDVSIANSEKFYDEYGWNPHHYNYVEADTKAEIVAILQKDIKDWKCMTATKNALFQIKWRETIIADLEE